ncbi:hypothetical protein P872_23555 [Rhodonellum psychrophilum GCM71 = DSM 17998]|uniref:Uncharacterized protein n=1 Tax=Rhodonellum psychrophilum GCM71 = DSM 17998 TaxID=1123057 RepID=U5C4E2_9BACT|nr:hypothetical protein P872_23555 [Rhodonellum psychrophilum GCM71 = DSM 17998]
MLDYPIKNNEKLEYEHVIRSCKKNDNGQERRQEEIKKTSHLGGFF